MAEVGEHSRDPLPSRPLVSDLAALAVIMLVLGACGGVLAAYVVTTFL